MTKETKTRDEHSLLCIRDLLDRTLKFGTIDHNSRVDLESALSYCETGTPKIVGKAISTPSMWMPNGKARPNPRRARYGSNARAKAELSLAYPDAEDRTPASDKTV